MFYNATIKHLGQFGHAKAAKTAQMPSSVSSLTAANAATRYSGTQSIQTSISGSFYTLTDATRGLGVKTYNMNKGTNYSTAVDFTDADNNWTAAEFDNINKDNGALDAHWGAEKTYDYWSVVHGRNSYNNAGAMIKSYVHYRSAYDNAFWNGSVMTYGDGSGTYFDILTSIDVAAHEIGHAVCSSTANLAYQKESGALNEAFSDIWAACVEYYGAPDKQIWLIGEDIERRAGHLSLRSMSNPNAESQPDTYGGTYWKNVNCVPSSSNDYCGVHTNSGVLNHWFYILTIGKTGTNDIGSVFSVAGIGIDKAAKIAYRLESVYLSSNSTFANARTYGIQAAIDLYGINSDEVIATTNAFYAVGVGAAYAGASDTIAPTAPLNLVASATSQTTTTLTWTPSSDNIAVTGYNVYQGTVLIGTTATNSYLVTGLTASTTYSFSVKAKDAAENLSLQSNVVTETTTSLPNVTYCSSQANSATNERIGKVVFGSISNTSVGTSGYENFTAISTSVNSGSTYLITITPVWKSKKNREGYAVFIDYNADGDFSDAGEKVWTKAVSTTSPVSGTFTIPANATLGTTRMRIAMKNGAIPTSCEVFAFGQVEDYSVVILQTPLVFSTISTITALESNLDFILYPNPADTSLRILLTATSIKDSISFLITNSLGQEVKEGQLSNENIDVEDLTSGIYYLKLKHGSKTVIKKFIKR